jgi:Holliday junction resolvasome RuvABC endonuclease subunit
LRILAVDPGKHGCGIACLVQGSSGVDLHFAQFVPLHGDETEGPAACVSLACAVEEALRARAFTPDAVVVETMKVYTAGKARPSDLLHLHGVAMAVCARFPRAQHVGVDAGIWKGQVPRDVMGARVAAKIEARGWASKITSPSRATHLNDVRHAVGLAIFITEKGASLLRIPSGRTPAVAGSPA